MAFLISPEAQNDLENIWLYTFENWSITQADRYLKQLLDEIEYLDANPDSGRDRSGIRKDYRSSKVNSHVIFYRIQQNKTDIEIIRILHQRMDFENRLTD